MSLHRMRRREFALGSLALLAGSPFLRAAAPAPAFAPPLPFTPDPVQRGRLARSLALLAGSTPARRHRVRVLFYGQSITEQSWSRDVADWLRATYPHADLVAENRAIGGHAAQLLVKAAEADLYPFQPDLVVFHVYGHHERLEDIVRRIRERTVADVLLQTDHPTRPEELDEETNPARLTPKEWSAWMNRVHLPGVAQRHGACLADIRSLWKRHLRDTQLPPSALLRDGVHLNEHGCFLMAEFVRAFLAPPAPDPALDPMDCPRVRTVPVPRGDGPWEVPFFGNRVDAVVGPAAGPVDVRVDGRAPSAWGEACLPTRVSAFPGSNWPVLLRVQADAPRVPEDWTLTLRGLSDDLASGRFAMRGSVTGDDGEGRLGEKFVSRSGRVVIEPDDWNLRYCHQVFHRGLPDGHTATWRVNPPGADRLMLEKAGEVGVVWNLPEGAHRIRFGSRRGLRALRVYSPSGRAA